MIYVKVAEGEREHAIYECHRVRIVPLQDTSQDHNTVRNGVYDSDHIGLILEEDAGERLVTILEPNKTEVYIMSETGKTIDTYRWDFDYENIPDAEEVVFEFADR